MFQKLLLIYKNTLQSIIVIIVLYDISYLFLIIVGTLFCKDVMYVFWEEGLRPLIILKLQHIM